MDKTAEENHSFDILDATPCRLFLTARVHSGLAGGEAAASGMRQAQSVC